MNKIIFGDPPKRKPFHVLFNIIITTSSLTNTHSDHVQLKCAAQVQLHCIILIPNSITVQKLRLQS